MASMTQSPVSFTGNLASKPSASDLLKSSSNSVYGVPLKALGRAQLGAKRRDFTISARVRKVKKHEYPWPEDPDPNVKGGVLRHLSPFKPLKEKPKPVTLGFEKPLMELQKKIDDVLKNIYTNLTPMQRVNIARHPNRPTFLDHVFNITEKFVELHGDRAGYDDPSVVTGLGTINDTTYMFMGHQKGRNSKENIQRNFGMPTPHGYRKALRMMHYADHHGFPIVTFIDTPGAFADLKSEELGQGEAIAQNLRTMFGLKVPIVSIVLGEGGSGGALAIGCGNKLLMLENAVFYVASPEASAAIMWKDAKASPEAAEKMKITAHELCKLEVADGIIPEPLRGAHTDSYWTSQQIKTAIVESMDELGKMNIEELLKHRAQKFRKIGGVQEGIPIDPKKKNMKKKLGGFQEGIPIDPIDPIDPKKKNMKKKLGGFQEGIPIDPIDPIDPKKKNMKKKLGGFQKGIPIDPKKNFNKKKKEEAVAVSKTSEVELRRDKVPKLKQQIQKAGKVTAKHPERSLNEMINKLKREIYHEYEEAAKALGLEDKIVMLREEDAKARNLKDHQLTPALKEKIGQFNDEFNKNLPSAPNYSSLKYKLDMLKKLYELDMLKKLYELEMLKKLTKAQNTSEKSTNTDKLKVEKELSKAQNTSEKSTNTDKLKVEIEKIFKEVMDRPDLNLKQKIETVKGEITKSGVWELVNLNQDRKEKFVQLSEELDSEFKSILEPMGLQAYPRSVLEAKPKLDTFNEETDVIIKDAINSSNLKDKIDLLKMVVANAGNTPDAESKSKIQALEAEIKQAFAEAVSSPELKEKCEKLLAQTLEATKSSVGSNGNLVKQNVDDQSKHDGLQLEVNSDANHSFF